jgi:hypothetical protein
MRLVLRQEVAGVSASGALSGRGAQRFIRIDEIKGYYERVATPGLAEDFCTELRCFMTKAAEKPESFQSGSVISGGRICGGSLFTFCSASLVTESDPCRTPPRSISIFCIQTLTDSSAAIPSGATRRRPCSKPLIVGTCATTAFSRLSVAPSTIAWPPA